MAGNTDELRLLARPREIGLADIATPVGLWHGEADVTVAATMARYLASRRPRCEATLPVNHADSILAVLKGEGSP